MKAAMLWVAALTSSFRLSKNLLNPNPGVATYLGLGDAQLREQIIKHFDALGVLLLFDLGSHDID